MEMAQLVSFPKKVLAVDDSLATLDLIKNTLALEGIEVEIADNGAEALSKYVKFKPDLVTLDVTMPVMDGIETLSRLIRLDKDAKVIMLTAAEHWSLIESCLAKGAIGYLQKPFYVDELVSMIKDPWCYEDKNAVMLFSISCNKISNSFDRLLNSKISVELNSIEVIKQEISSVQFSPNQNVSQIRVINRLANMLQVEAPQASMGFVNEFDGQLNGKIISFVKIEHLPILRNATINYYGKESIPEVFYLLHSKIFSTLVDRTHLRLQLEPARQFDPQNDKNVPENIEAIKALYEIKNDQFVLPIETQLWANLKQAFRTF
jgi:two-component system chemotaxis response regulator CheY